MDTSFAVVAPSQNVSHCLILSDSPFPCSGDWLRRDCLREQMPATPSCLPSMQNHWNSKILTFLSCFPSFFINKKDHDFPPHSFQILHDLLVIFALPHDYLTPHRLFIFHPANIQVPFTECSPSPNCFFTSSI